MQYLDLNEHLPKGEYEVHFDGKLLAKFPKLETAQKFIAEKGLRSAQIIFPNLREKMTKEDIAAVEYMIERFGKEKDPL